MARCPTAVRGARSPRSVCSRRVRPAAVRVVDPAHRAGRHPRRLRANRLGSRRHRAARAACGSRCARPPGCCASSRRTGCPSSKHSGRSSPETRSATSCRSGRSSASRPRRRSSGTRSALGPAVTALAIENVLYTLSVAAMIAAGMAALLFVFDLPARAARGQRSGHRRPWSLLFVLALVLLWRRPALASRVVGPGAAWRARRTPRRPDARARGSRSIRSRAGAGAAWCRSSATELLLPRARRARGCT